MKATITEWKNRVHQNAVEHGWWEEPREMGTLLMLIVTEVAEAMEEYRNNKAHVYTVDGKPEGIASELADCIIRVLDICGKYDIDIERAVEVKHAYNKTRAYKHGGKQA